MPSDNAEQRKGSKAKVRRCLLEQHFVPSLSVEVAEEPDFSLPRVRLLAEEASGTLDMCLGVFFPRNRPAGLR